MSKSRGQTPMRRAVRQNTRQQNPKRLRGDGKEVGHSPHEEGGLKAWGGSPIFFPRRRKVKGYERDNKGRVVR